MRQIVVLIVSSLMSIQGSPCRDDPEWKDKDGTGCAAYAHNIKAGQFTMAFACSYEDGVAKAHCPMTCNVCGSCMDEPDWKDKDGSGCASYAKMIKAGQVSQSYACTYEDDAAKKHCPMTCHTCNKETKAHTAPKKKAPSASPPAPSPVVTISPSPAPEKACVDNAAWKDKDGTDCAAYAAAVKAGTFTLAYACHYQDDGAMKNCPMTCHSCPKESQASSVSHTDPKPAAAVATAPKPAPAPAEVCRDDAEWKDKDGTDCLGYAHGILRGEYSLSYACDYDNGAAKKNCALTCKACKGCMDDSQWKDKDGSDCEAYAHAVKAGMFSLNYACSYDNAQASEYCPKTCNMCPTEADTFSASPAIVSISTLALISLFMSSGGAVIILRSRYSSSTEPEGVEPLLASY